MLQLRRKSEGCEDVLLLPCHLAGDGGAVGGVDSAEPLEMRDHLRESHAELAAVRLEAMEHFAVDDQSDHMDEKPAVEVLLRMDASARGVHLVLEGVEELLDAVATEVVLQQPEAVCARLAWNDYDLAELQGVFVYRVVVSDDAHLPGRFANRVEFGHAGGDGIDEGGGLLSGLEGALLEPLIDQRKLPQKRVGFVRPALEVYEDMGFEKASGQLDAPHYMAHRAILELEAFRDLVESASGFDKQFFCRLKTQWERHDEVVAGLVERFHVGGAVEASIHDQARVRQRVVRLHLMKEVLEGRYVAYAAGVDAVAERASRTVGEEHPHVDLRQAFAVTVVAKFVESHIGRIRGYRCDVEDQIPVPSVQIRPFPPEPVARGLVLAEAMQKSADRLAAHRMGLHPFCRMRPVVVEIHRGALRRAVGCQCEDLFPLLAEAFLKSRLQLRVLGAFPRCQDHAGSQLRLPAPLLLARRADFAGLLVQHAKILALLPRLLFLLVPNAFRLVDVNLPADFLLHLVAHAIPPWQCSSVIIQ